MSCAMYVLIAGVLPWVVPGKSRLPIPNRWVAEVNANGNIDLERDEDAAPVSNPMRKRRGRGAVGHAVPIRAHGDERDGLFVEVAEHKAYEACEDDVTGENNPSNVMLKQSIFTPKVLRLLGPQSESKSEKEIVVCSTNIICVLNPKCTLVAKPKPQLKPESKQYGWTVYRGSTFDTVCL